MKRFLIPLLLSLLLCGCAAQNPQPTETLPSPLPPVIRPEAAPAQAALSLEPLAAEGAAKQFSLSEAVTGFLLLEENLLFFSGQETATTLTLLDPETMEAIAVHEVPFVLAAENATVQVLAGGLSYFHSAAGETVVLDTSLREIRRIAAPEGLTGMPLLSADGQQLYYCTSDAVRVLDLEHHISRILKETAYPVQGLSGLLLEDTVLQISITEAGGIWRTIFLSTETGQLLQDPEGNLTPQTIGQDYFFHGRLDGIQTILFGSAGGTAQTLHPRLEAEDAFFLGQFIATTAWQDGLFCLDLYDLDTGLRTASLAGLPGACPEAAIMDGSGRIWILWSQEDGQMRLSQWEPAGIQENTVYTFPYYTRQDPDYEGLAACSLYAEELSAKHGIEILVYKDAAAVEPWDYHLEYEYQASVLRRELNALDARLSSFPAGFLQTLTEKFTALKICLVRSAEGSPESGSPSAVNGIQFMDDFDAYIVLATNHDTGYTLYHELSHLMETVVLTESVAYDRWDNLNPPDFHYDNDYTANRTRDGSPWLKEGSEYFIDTYSMSYPKEDRARLFEYAMTEGHEDLFTSPNLQQKLRQLCIGIREGFGLEAYAGPLPWEQYLSESK